MSTVAVLALGALGGGFVTGLAGYYGRVSDRQFRAVVLWLLLASGVALMVSNLR